MENCPKSFTYHQVPCLSVSLPKVKPNMTTKAKLPDIIPISLDICDIEGHRIWAVAAGLHSTAFVFGPLCKIVFVQAILMNPIWIHHTGVPKTLIEKSGECHNHKPQPIPNTMRKRKRTKINLINKQMHKKHIDQLSLPQATWKNKHENKERGKIRPVVKTTKTYKIRITPGLPP